MMIELACGQRAMEAAMDNHSPDFSKNRTKRSVMKQFTKQERNTYILILLVLLMAALIVYSDMGKATDGL